MKQTINKYAFERAFKDADRADNFSRAGLNALFDYFEDYEQSTGEEIELDVVAICCDYCEYDSAPEAASEYGWEPNPDDDEADTITDAIEWLTFRTQVITTRIGSVIIATF